MPFSVHTFETNPEANLGFAYHEKIAEGRNVYFLAKFPSGSQDAQGASEAIFGAIVDHFRRASALEAYDQFEEALKVANLEYKKHLRDIPSVPEIVVAFFDFHHLYLTQSGQSEAYLLREGQVSQITEIPEDSDDLFVNILSGQISVEDIVLLSSHRILRTLTANQLSEIFNRPNFGEATNIFKHELSQKSEEDMLVTLIGVGKKESTPAAGFLSKVMSGNKSTATTTPAIVEDVKEKEPEDTPPTPPEPINEPVNEPEPEISAPEVAESEPIKPAVLPKEAPKMPIMPDMPKLNLGNWIEKVKGFRPKKNLLILAGVVFLLFAVGVGLKSVNWESEEEVFLREQLDIAREALQQADSSLVQGERETAKEQLGKANDSVQEIFKSKSKLFRSDAQFLLADIKSKQLQVENAKQVTPNLVADLSIKNDDFKANGIARINESFFSYNNKSVVKNIRNVVDGSVNVTESGSVIAGASRESQKTVTFLTEGPRLVEYRDGILTPMETQDENWKGGIDLRNYTDRFTYILSPNENQIWKYERRRSNYSEATAYNQGANLAEAVSFTIDGNIYILSADGGIQKLFRGVAQDYDFEELPSVGFEGPSLKIYTTDDLEFIYVLDPDNTRVLIFNKGDRYATYRRQVMYDIEGARDFVVDDSGLKVTLVTDDKIYEFSL